MNNKRGAQSNKEVDFALKFTNHNLYLIKKDLLSNQLTPDQRKKLENVKDSLIQERDGLKQQNREEKVGAHVKQSLKIIADLKDKDTREKLFKDQYRVLSISQITSTTPGVMKLRKKIKKEGDIFS